MPQKIIYINTIINNKYRNKTISHIYSKYLRHTHQGITSRTDDNRKIFNINCWYSCRTKVKLFHINTWQQCRKYLMMCGRRRRLIMNFVCPESSASVCRNVKKRVLVFSEEITNSFVTSKARKRTP